MIIQENNLLEDGHLSDDAVARYAQAALAFELPPLEEKALTHVESCAECKDKILDITTFLRNSESVPAAQFLPLKPQKNQKATRHYFHFSMRIAALFFAAIVLAGLYFFVYQGDSIPFLPSENDFITLSSKQADVNGSKNNSITSQNTTDTHSEIITTQPAFGVKNANTNPAITARFRVNPNFESMIDNSYRSSVPEVVSPQNNTHFDGIIQFSWKELRTFSPVTLKVFSNENELMSEYSVTGTGFIFKEKLEPGLYYWKLENNNELLYIGKFFVTK